MRSNLHAPRSAAGLVFATISFASLAITLVACGGELAPSVQGEYASLRLLESPVRGDVAVVGLTAHANVAIKDAELFLDDVLVASLVGRLPSQLELPVGALKDGLHRLALTVHTSDGDLRMVLQFPVARTGGGA